MSPYKFYKRKAAKAVTIIGGADGPTSIFVAGKIGKTGRKTFKKQIRGTIYRWKRKRVEASIKAGTHTLEEVAAYIINKYRAKELSKKSRSYQEQRTSLKEGLIAKHKPELLGDLKDMPKLETFDEKEMKELHRFMQLRSERIANISDEVITMDFHVYIIHIKGGTMEIAMDYIWDILEISYSGDKKVMRQLNKMSQEIHMYYGVTQKDIQKKTKRYSALVTSSCT